MQIILGRYQKLVLIVSLVAMVGVLGYFIYASVREAGNSFVIMSNNEYQQLLK